MQKLTFKQQLILAIIAGVFAVMAASVSHSPSNGTTMEGTQINQSPVNYAVSNGNGNSSSTTTISINDSRVMSTNHSIAAIVNGDVVQGNNVNINKVQGSK